MAIELGAGAAIHQGDCIEVMAELPAESISAVICDPPYGLAFMGKGWDKYTPKDFQDWCQEWAEQAIRVLKPGGHLAAFGGTRTYHRLACAIEDAGFEIRDSLMWLYGSGFPKSLDVSKAIDKARHSRSDALRVTAWISENATAGQLDAAAGTNGMGGHWTSKGSQPIIPTSEAWSLIRHLMPEPPDWLSALIKPAHSPGDAWHDREKVGEKVLSSFSYAPGQGNDCSAKSLDITAPATDEASQWQGWGTALKPAYEPIVLARKPLGGTVSANVLEHGTGAINVDGCRIESEGGLQRPGRNGAGNVGGWANYSNDWTTGTPDGTGRWPANVLLDEVAAARLDGEVGESRDGVAVMRNLPDEGSSKRINIGATTKRGADFGYGGQGGPSRFFYTAKTSTAERDGTTHPTVKPIDLMRWLVRLLTPPGGVVLDPFLGSGTTLLACKAEGVECIGIEREPEYVEQATERYRKRWDPANAEQIDREADEAQPSLFESHRQALSADALGAA